MSTKLGRRAPNRKPKDEDRQGVRTSGAFGKETSERVVGGAADRNIHKSVRREVLRAT